MDKDAILTQDAIDALLSALPEDDTPTPVPFLKLRSMVEQPEAPISTSLPGSPGGVAQAAEHGITMEQVIEIAGQAAEAESAPLQASIARISERVGALETALDRIVELEAELSQLRNAA